MRGSIASALVVYAAQSAAQNPYWQGYQFEIRDFNDVFDYDTRGFEESYDLAARDFDDSHDFVTRDLNDDYTYAVRSYEPDDSLYARDMSFVTTDFQPLLIRDPFMSGSSWHRPSLSDMLNKLSSPAHRDHSHVMFQGNHAFVVPPQHDPFENLLKSILPQPSMHQTHNSIMAHASVSNTGHGYSCTSSTIIGIDGIPHTTKHCSNTTPDSHVSITVGPSSDSDWDSDFFSSDPFADLFTDSHSDWHDSAFHSMHTPPKLLRSKRILDLDSAPHRGEIHSFSDSESAEHADHVDEHDEHEHEDHVHDSPREKHELRGDEARDHDRYLEHFLTGDKKEKKEKKGSSEAETGPKVAAQHETHGDDK